MYVTQISGCLSLIYPGLGHLYLKNYRKATIYAVIPFLFILTYILSPFIALWNAPLLWRVLHLFITTYWFSVFAKTVRYSRFSDLKISFLVQTKLKIRSISLTFLVLIIAIVTLPFYVYMGCIIFGSIIY